MSWQVTDSQRGTAIENEVGLLVMVVYFGKMFFHKPQYQVLFYEHSRSGSFQCRWVPDRASIST